MLQELLRQQHMCFALFQLCRTYPCTRSGLFPPANPTSVTFASEAERNATLAQLWPQAQNEWKLDELLMQARTVYFSMYYVQICAAVVLLMCSMCCFKQFGRTDIFCMWLAYPHLLMFS
jgi:hypothetical protein